MFIFSLAPKLKFILLFGVYYPWQNRFFATLTTIIYKFSSSLNTDSRIPSFDIFILTQGYDDSVVGCLSKGLLPHYIEFDKRYTVSREQLKFKLEELIQLYLVLNTMGYHLKICTISYDDVLNSIQFYQI